MVSPHDTLLEASRKMKSAGCGGLPVGTEKKLEGFITDRDIVVRACAAGEDPAQARVREYMSTRVRTCGDGDTVDDALEKMRANAVGRLVVTGGNDIVLGILSYGRIMRAREEERGDVFAGSPQQRDIPALPH
jgi:CBS domain-containing protein